MRPVDSDDLMPDDVVLFDSMAVGRVVNVTDERIQLQFWDCRDIGNYTYAVARTDLNDGRLPDDRVLRSVTGLIPSRLSFARLEDRG